jgi:hypothetical protein
MAATLTQTDSVEGGTTKLFKKSLTFNAGTPAADLAATSVGTSLSGFLSAVRVLFGTTPPDSITVTLKDADGHTLATGTLTASGEIDLDGETPVFVNGLSVAVAGNTTDGATALISLLYFT